MRLIADLHIHSRYSRATSSKLTVPHLERWARIKGINLVGAGDCTHPQWLQELRSQTDDAEDGFYVVKPEVRDAFNAGSALIEGLPLPGKAASESLHTLGEAPRFVLSGEISTIYKKGDKTRKIHHVVILPDFRAAAAFNTKLESSGGNIRSDGRPILGMDSKDLFSLLLEADERSLLIPAHIWTPWFSVLGANSGFDSIEECYGDLAQYIPAIETGLSSNPPMNWALNSLDKFSIVSNSDAHSPEKLGREATIFEMDLSFASLRKALYSRSSPGEFTQREAAVLGTIEFFPQEGKYHYDGHRKCAVSLDPEAAAGLDYMCPVCKKPLTRGVMGRVLELADRSVNESESCPDNFWGSNRRPYYSLIPLKEIIAELVGTGTASKKVEGAYCRLIEKGGSEFSILMDKGRDELEKLETSVFSGKTLADAIIGMREGKVSVKAGYDGEYGSIRVFPAFFSSESGGKAGKANLFGEILANESEEYSTVKSLRPEPKNPGNVQPRTSHPKTPHSKLKTKIPEVKAEMSRIFAANEDQEKIIAHNGKETIIIAGPGTGKTAVLVARIERLISNGADPSSILALTFTVKAAAQLRERGALNASTFHSFCCSILREQSAQAGLPPDFKILTEAERDSLLKKIGGREAKRLGLYIEERKRYLLLPGESALAPPILVHYNAKYDSLEALLSEAAADIKPPDAKMEALYEKYRKALKNAQSLDFEDLTSGTVRLLAYHPEILACYQQRFKYIFVDEYQDLNFSQYMLVRLLVPGGEGPSLWVIGDPNQAIYGFRGSDKRFIDRFLQDYPNATRFELSKSFRCATPIINAAGQLTGTRLKGREETQGDTSRSVSLFRTQYATEKSEAEGIARTIAALTGGTSFFAHDSGVAGGNNVANGNIGPGDCAVLVRTSAMAAPIIKALNDHGLPYENSNESPWWTEEPAASIIGVLRECRKKLGSGGEENQPAFNPADLITTAWEEINKKEKPGRRKKETPVAVERLVNLAGLFSGLSSLLDALDSASASHISEPGGFKVMRNNAVRVMTIHASKGLEFEQVFVAGLEEGMLPFTLYDSDDEEKEPSEGRTTSSRIEEERRLLYVAMTRAKQGLWLSWARSRTYRGRKLSCNPSRFLSELEKIIPLSDHDKGKKWDGQLSLF